MFSALSKNCVKNTCSYRHFWRPFTLLWSAPCEEENLILSDKRTVPTFSQAKDELHSPILQCFNFVKKIRILINKNWIIFVNPYLTLLQTSLGFSLHLKRKYYKSVLVKVKFIFFHRKIITEFSLIYISNTFYLRPCIRYGHSQPKAQLP